MRVEGPGSRVQGPGSRVQSPESRVEGIGFRVSGFRLVVFGVQGFGSCFECLGFEIWGLELKIWGLKSGGWGLPEELHEEHPEDDKHPDREHARVRHWPCRGRDSRGEDAELSNSCDEAEGAERAEDLEEAQEVQLHVRREHLKAEKLVFYCRTTSASTLHIQKVVRFGVQGLGFRV